jgi:hypothetical protein
VDVVRFVPSIDGRDMKNRIQRGVQKKLSTRMCRLDAEVAQLEVTIPWGRKPKIGVSILDGRDDVAEQYNV